MLKPCGSAVVRFLDAEGKPAADFEPTVHMVVTPGINPYDYQGMRAGTLTADSDYLGNIDRVNYATFASIRADASGKLKLPALIPGTTYWIITSREGQFEIAKEFVAKSGETLDLGDVNAAPKKPPLSPGAHAGQITLSPGAHAGQITLSPGAHAGQITINGLVLLPSGQPAAGATVRAAAPLYAMLEPLLGTTFKSPMSEVKADSSGRFTIEFTTQPFGDVRRLDPHWQQLWKKTVIAASLDGYGPNWVSYEDIEAKQQPLTLKLVADLPIRGRVIDLEGQPIAGVAVKVGEPRAAENERSVQLDRGHQSR